MSKCQRCWTDAISCKSRGGVYDELSVGEKYSKLVIERECTPEQQAGIGAIECPYCHRKTVHVMTNELMCSCTKEDGNECA